MKSTYKDWPFATWTQGYVLGLLNGAIVGMIIAAFVFFVAGT